MHISILFVIEKCNQVFPILHQEQACWILVSVTPKIFLKKVTWNTSRLVFFFYPICSLSVFLKFYLFFIIIIFLSLGKNEFFHLECDNYINLVARVQRRGCSSKFKMLVYIRSYRLVELISPLSSFFLISQQLVG